MLLPSSIPLGNRRPEKAGMAMLGLELLINSVVILKCLVPSLLASKTGLTTTIPVSAWPGVFKFVLVITKKREPRLPTRLPASLWQAQIQEIASVPDCGFQLQPFFSPRFSASSATLG